MTTALEPTTEEEAYNMDFVDLYEKMEDLKKRVIVKILHIQHVKLVIGRGAYQPGELLEEVGIEPTKGEMTAKISEEEAEKQFSDETIELESTGGWQYKVAREEGIKGDHDDLPIDKEEVQQRRLHKKSQPLEQPDEVIIEIRKMMLKSTEVANKEKLNKGQ
jgi:hypothetical protein